MGRLWITNWEMWTGELSHLERQKKVKFAYFWKQISLGPTEYDMVLNILTMTAKTLLNLKFNVSDITTEL
jgi:hypothetical protein